MLTKPTIMKYSKENYIDINYNDLVLTHFVNHFLSIKLEKVI